MRVPPGCPLTPRQLEVLDLVSQGLTTRDVAKRLDVTYCTASTHLKNAYRALGVHNAANAVALLGRHGWTLHSPPPAPELTLEPLQQAVHDQLHDWVISRFTDQQARDAWHIAYRALRVAHGQPAERPHTQGPRHSQLRDLLQTLAADTLEPTQR